MLIGEDAGAELTPELALERAPISEQTLEHEAAAVVAVEAVLGGEPDAAEHLEAVAAGDLGGPAGQRLGHRGARQRLGGRRGHGGGVGSRDRDERLGQPMLDRLEAADGCARTACGPERRQSPCVSNSCAPATSWCATATRPAASAAGQSEGATAVTTPAGRAGETEQARPSGSMPPTGCGDERTVEVDDRHTVTAQVG